MFGGWDMVGLFTGSNTHLIHRMWYLVIPKCHSALAYVQTKIDPMCIDKIYRCVVNIGGSAIQLILSWQCLSQTCNRIIFDNDDWVVWWTSSCQMMQNRVQYWTTMFVFYNTFTVWFYSFYSVVVLTTYTLWVHCFPMSFVIGPVNQWPGHCAKKACLLLKCWI